MRVVIAGSDLSTVSRIASYLGDCGHSSMIARNGSECKAVIREVAPDLLVLEFDPFWDASEGVMAVMRNAPQSQDVPVVLYTERYKQFDSDAGPRIIASLSHPLRLTELSRLENLLGVMGSMCVGNSFSAKRYERVNGNREMSILF
jgi:DNA-binding response OmpR family regulator